MNNILTYLFIATGGALGAMLRYFLSQAALVWFGKTFPFGTLIVNIIGAFLMGFLYTLIAQGWLQDVPWRAFIGIGLLGALTTFSTFSIETLFLLQQGEWLKAGLNILLNVCVCLLAVWLGSKLAGIKF